MEKKNYIVAIDLGSSNVVVAVAERDAEGRPVVRSIVSKPSQGVKAGMITNIEQVSNSIKAAVEAVGEELGIRITEAYTGISGDFVRCARHTDHVFTSDPQNGVNRTDVEALFDRMRNVQAPDDETIMERIPQNYLVDENQEVADPVGSFGKRLASTFNFILCAKTPIERLNLALRRLGIRSLGMYANALVTGAAVLSADEKEEGAAVVNIGGGVTDVAVYYRNVPRYIATIPMGAGAINNDIRTLGILERHVDSLKRKFGSAVAELAPENKMVSVKGRTAKETKDILLHNLAVVIESRARDIAEYAAMALAELCFDTLMEEGVKAKIALEAGVCTPAVEKIIEANTLLSGIGFESAGLAGAHAIHNGLTVLEECHHMYHGEKVAFGTLAQLVLENVPHEELEEIIMWCIEVGLPVTLEELGAGNVTDEQLMEVAKAASAEGDTLQNMPFTVTPESVFAAIKAADAYGRYYLGEE